MPEPAAPALSHRLAVCSWSLRPSEPRELVERLAACGVRATQLALIPLLESEHWAKAASLLEASGIAIASGMVGMHGEDYSSLESIARTGGVRPDETWPANLARCREAAALAADLGLRLVTFHAGFIPEDAGDPGRRTVLERLRQLADLFADHGVRIGLETGQENADTLLEALEELARPDVGVNFDPANMILYGMGDPVASLEKLAPRVVQMHAKDAVPTAVPGTWGREVPLGDGAVDWTALLAVAAAIPDLPVAIEREAGEDRVDEIRLGRERLLEWWPAGR